MTWNVGVESNSFQWALRGGGAPGSPTRKLWEVKIPRGGGHYLRLRVAVLQVSRDA